MREGDYPARVLRVSRRTSFMERSEVNTRKANGRDAAHPLAGGAYARGGATPVTRGQA